MRHANFFNQLLYEMAKTVSESVLSFVPTVGLSLSEDFASPFLPANLPIACRGGHHHRQLQSNLCKR